MRFKKTLIIEAMNEKGFLDSAMIAPDDFKEVVWMLANQRAKVKTVMMAENRARAVRKVEADKQIKT